MGRDGLQSVKETVRKKLGPDRFTTLKVIICRLYCKFKRTDKRLLEMKNRHKGDRCFVVATGPSLTIEDLEKLKGEVCFSLNSIVKLFDKTDWRPTYYVISDPDVYDVLGKEIVHADLETVFFNAFDILNFVKEGIPYKGSSEYMIRDRSRNSKKKLDHILFSIEAKKGFYTWYTTLGTILQMAVYMGFHEIYLIGADCNYQKEQHHAEGTNYNCRPWPDAGAKAIRDYKLAVPILEDLGVKVFNATRGGALEVFPRVNIDEILL